MEVLEMKGNLNKLTKLIRFYHQMSQSMTMIKFEVNQREGNLHLVNTIEIQEITVTVNKHQIRTIPIMPIPMDNTTIIVTITNNTNSKSKSPIIEAIPNQMDGKTNNIEIKS